MRGVVAARALIGMCVDGIMTNHPTTLERLLERSSVTRRCRRQTAAPGEG